jgi:hypothetical protein
MNHEQYIRASPERVHQNLAAMRIERDEWIAKQQRARSEQGKRNCDGSIRWAEKMIARYQDDLRIIGESAYRERPQFPPSLPHIRAHHVIGPIHAHHGFRFGDQSASACTRARRDAVRLGHHQD